MAPKSLRCILLGLALLAVLSMTAFAVDIDASAPVVSSLAALPSTVRVGIDSTVTIVATANDTSKGGSNIAAAEYYIGADPGAGGGVAMSAVDGAFNGPLEVIMAAISTVGWPDNVTIHVRARDAAGNWCSPVNVAVTVTTDVTPPGAVSDLKGSAAGSIEPLSLTISGYSSAGSNSPVTAILDSDTGTSWMTAGTTTPQTEYVTLDLTSIETVAYVLLIAGDKWKLFPSTVSIEGSLDGEEWEPMAASSVARIASLGYLWECEPTQVRYVKISGPGVYNGTDRRYYWQVADASVFTTEGMLVSLSWTAPANDGYAGGGSSESAQSYDIRYDSTGITEENFTGRIRATGYGSPGLPGHSESGAIRVNSTDVTLNIALKTNDDAGNWSTLSNVIQVKPNVTGFESMSPEDADMVTATDAPAFALRVEPGLTKEYMCFSGSSAFPERAVTAADGQVERSVRFPVKVGTVAWTPTAAQWKAIKAVVTSSGILYWRAEGTLGLYIAVFGPTRTLEFDTGMIMGLSVDPSHFVLADEGVWPDSAVAPTFQWMDATTEMKYFLVDISTAENIPLKDARKTIVLGGQGIVGESCTATKAQWRRMKQLAAANSGTLYWRVRAKDADRALSAVSEVSKLVVDGGTWTLPDPETDPVTEMPTYSWTHNGEGLVKFNLQFSANALFPASARETLTVPAAPVAGDSYTLKPAEVSRLQKFAASKGVTGLFWRVRGTDADRVFTVYSSPKAP